MRDELLSFEMFQETPVLIWAVITSGSSLRAVVNTTPGSSYVAILYAKHSWNENLKYMFLCERHKLKQHVNQVQL